RRYLPHLHRSEPRKAGPLAGSTPLRGERHETATELPGPGDGADQADVRPGEVPRGQWAGAQPAGTGDDPRVADQWLRVLPGHAYAGRAGRRRDGAEDLRSERLARDAVLQRPRAGSAGLD